MRKIFVFLSLIYVVSIYSCTHFLLKDQNNQCVIGRSMEFGVDVQSQIVVFPSGQTHESLIDGHLGMRWTQKYAFVGMNVFHDDSLIIDGMNEKGLSIGGLWLPGTKYPSPKQKDLEQMVALKDIGSWVLGSFATVSEVRKALQKVVIYPTKVPELGKVPPLHFAIDDQLGQSIVIEFTDGKMNIFDNVVGVLTNAPTFDWHLTNLRNYISLSALNKGAVDLDGSVLDPTGQGSGMLGLPGDWTPPSRFVRIAAMKQFVSKTPTQGKNVNLAFHLLNTVDIPYGAIQQKDGKDFDYTQWIVVKDLANGNFYFRTYDNLNIGSINLRQAARKGFQKFNIE